MQQLGSNYFACRPPYPTLEVKTSKKKLFQNMVLLHIKLKRITNAASRLQIPPRPTFGSKGQNSTFSEYGHVEYQIKWDHECSNMVAIILPADPPSTQGVKRLNPTFSEHGHVAYQIKGNYECSKMIANILPADPQPLTLRVGSKGQNSTFIGKWSCCIPK